MPEYKAAKGTSPGFVLDPAWPQPLPHHWVNGDIGGIAVDKHDHIWVYHRPRSVSSTDSGMQGATAKDARGRAISDLGFPRPNGQLNGCCMPAPSVLEFDQAGKLLQAWGGPGDPGFFKNKCNPEKNGCTWPAREHGIHIDQTAFVNIAGNGQAVNFHGQYPWAPNFGNDSQILKFKTDGTFVLQIGTPGAKGPNSNDTNGGINGTPEPFWPADMVVDPKTNYLYVADGYGNRRVVIVDAATGKYVGHFGAYGNNPIDDKAAAAAGIWMNDLAKDNMKPAFFRTPVHCVKIAKDGLLYVCDRGNNRVQVFNSRDPNLGRECRNPSGESGRCGLVKEQFVSVPNNGLTG